MNGVVGEQTAKPPSFVPSFACSAGPAVRGGKPVQNKPFSALHPNQHDYAKGCRQKKTAYLPIGTRRWVRPQTHNVFPPVAKRVRHSPDPSGCWTAGRWDFQTCITPGKNGLPSCPSWHRKNLGCVLSQNWDKIFFPWFLLFGKWVGIICKA